MRSEWDEWEAIFRRLDRTNREKVYLQLLTRYRAQLREQLWQDKMRARILAARQAVAQEEAAAASASPAFWPALRPTPLPIRLPLFHAAVTFTCLALLPQRPLSMPTALGIACVLVIYIQILAYRAGYRL